MELDIKLSIDKKRDFQHNTYLLRWNPAISSYTMERLDADMNEWLDGYWGNGDERKVRLRAAGYDYDAVQDRVNEILLGVKN